MPEEFAADKDIPYQPQYQALAHTYSCYFERFAYHKNPVYINLYTSIYYNWNISRGNKRKDTGAGPLKTNRPRTLPDKQSTRPLLSRFS